MNENARTCLTCTLQEGEFHEDKELVTFSFITSTRCDKCRPLWVKKQKETRYLKSRYNRLDTYNESFKKE